MCGRAPWKLKGELCWELLFSSVTQSCPTLCDPMDCRIPGFLIHHQLPEPAQTHVHHISDAIQPSHPLSSTSPPASIFPSIRVSSKELVLRIRWPKYWSFSFNISPANEYSGLISFSVDWLDLLAVQGTLKSLLQHPSSKPLILWCSVSFIVQLSHLYMNTGKTMALTRWTFVCKGCYLFFLICCLLLLLSLQSCPTLCDPIDGSPPGSPVPGILQARTLEWAAVSFSNAWKWKVKVRSLSRVWLLVTPWTAGPQAPPSLGFSRQEYWSGLPLPSPNMLSRLVITFLPRSKHLLVSWLQSPSAVIWDPKK